MEKLAAYRITMLVLDILAAFIAIAYLVKVAQKSVDPSAVLVVLSVLIIIKFPLELRDAFKNHKDNIER